jgi:hypothetical protein
MPASWAKPSGPRTVTDTFEGIEAGSDPWIAIGEFLDVWRSTPLERRQELMATPITPMSENPVHQRWAAFCAAMVEQLCLEAGLAVPEWVFRSEYVLADPWYLFRGKTPQWRAWQEVASPEPFKKRHIYGGDRILARA